MSTVDIPTAIAMLRLFARGRLTAEERSRTNSALRYLQLVMQQDNLRIPPRGYETIEEIKTANKKSGGHWFDEGAIRFFNSRMLDEWVFPKPTPPKYTTGALFVSEETGPNEIPGYTIRQANSDGTIETLGEFQEYENLDDALRVALTLSRPTLPSK
jgi:hypothetical protein